MSRSSQMPNVVVLELTLYLVKLIFQYHHRHGRIHHWLIHLFLEQGNAHLQYEYLAEVLILACLLSSP
ncbi:MAG: hypothetical protein RMY27_16805 [Nostoc sp. DedQUE09]|nr:hypothetical protein [Nostoc sp. DedQUE09]